MYTNLFRLSWLMLLFLCVMASATLAQDHLPAHVVDEAYTKEWLLLGPFFPDNLETDFLINAGGGSGDSSQGRGYCHPCQ